MTWITFVQSSCPLVTWTSGGLLLFHAWASETRPKYSFSIFYDIEIEKQLQSCTSAEIQMLSLTGCFVFGIQNIDNWTTPTPLGCFFIRTEIMGMNLKQLFILPVHLITRHLKLDCRLVMKISWNALTLCIFLVFCPV